MTAAVHNLFLGRIDAVQPRPRPEQRHSMWGDPRRTLQGTELHADV